MKTMTVIQIKTKTCSYCKRSYPLVEDSGKLFMPGHAVNPKKPKLGHCQGSFKLVTVKL
jgi:hypothetical protein